MIDKQRLPADVRKEQIIEIAQQVVYEHGFSFPRLRTEIASRLGKWHTLITHYFPKDALRDELMRRAIASNNLRLIAEGIATKHHLVHDLSPKTRRKALNYWAQQLMG